MLQAMALNGSLQLASALLMLGLAAWSWCWCCNKQQPEAPDDVPWADRVGSELVGGAVMAAGIPEEEPPGTVPDLAVELAHSQLRKPASLT
jgi:hypothetical protein